MPKLNDPTMEVIKTTSNYGFSAVKIDSLGATEYTLATIVVDQSGSLSGQDRNIEKMIKEAIASCKKSPRSDNLMARVVVFSDSDSEMHGFRLLDTIQESEYDNAINTGGSTLLYDSAFHAIEATDGYAKVLKAQDYLTNAIVFVITDGMDTHSKNTPKTIKKVLDGVKKGENLESISVVLIGMTQDASAAAALDHFKTDAELSDYIEIGAVTPAKLAKLAKFISRSTSSTSQALGTGGPSVSLTF